MFIGHIPTNYLVACATDRIISLQFRTLALKIFVIAGILPDLDMLYFYLLDSRNHHHHLYWTHIPLYWIIMYIGSCVVSLLSRSRKLFILSSAFLLGIMMHLLLDTPMGGIAWLYPVSSKLYYWTIVPARYDWWVWNFIFHWTFLSELVISAAALIVFLRRRKNRQG